MSLIKKLTNVIIILSIFSSCAPDSYIGNKYYTLNANIDRGFIVEYELNFLSSDKVQFTQTFRCNSFECISKNNKTSRQAISIVRSYSIKEGFLKIEGVDNLYQFKLDVNGDIITEDGYTIYKTSIADCADEERQKRVLDIFKGNESLAEVFLGMLNNKSFKPLIEKKGDRLIFNK